MQIGLARLNSLQVCIENQKGKALEAGGLKLHKSAWNFVIKTKVKSQVCFIFPIILDQLYKKWNSHVPHHGNHDAGMFRIFFTKLGKIYSASFSINIAREVFTRTLDEKKISFGKF